MPDLRRLDEEVDEIMGSDVPTIRGTSACTSEKMSVRSGDASSALPVKAVTAEVRRVTLKCSSVSLKSRGSKKRKSECKLCSTGTFISIPVRHFAVPLHLSWYLTRLVGLVSYSMDPVASWGERSSSERTAKVFIPVRPDNTYTVFC